MGDAQNLSKNHASGATRVSLVAKKTAEASIITPMEAVTPPSFSLPSNIELIGLIQRATDSTNPENFDMESIYKEVLTGISAFRIRSHKMSRGAIEDFYTDENQIGSRFLQKEGNFRPTHILSEFNYTPLNQSLDNIVDDDAGEVVREAGRNDTGTARVWLRNHVAGVYKDWNARWAIIECLLEAEPKDTDLSDTYDVPNDDTSEGMFISYPLNLPGLARDYDPAEEFESQLENYFRPFVTQGIAAAILRFCIQLNLADSYLKSCYKISSPMTHYTNNSSERVISRYHQDPNFAKDAFNPSIRFGDGNIEQYFKNIETTHSRDPSENGAPSFGKKFSARDLEISYHVGLGARSVVTKKRSLALSVSPSDFESNRAQIQLLRDINLYADNLEFRSDPLDFEVRESIYKHQKVNYIPGPRQDIFDFRPPNQGATESTYHLGPSKRPGDLMSSYKKAFFIRKVLIKSKFLNSREAFIHTNHTIQDEGRESAIFPQNSATNVEGFLQENCDDISSFFYYPMRIGNKIVILGDSLEKDYYADTADDNPRKDMHFNSIVDDLEAKKVLISNTYQALMEDREEPDYNTAIETRFLPAPSKAELSKYVFEKLFPFFTSTRSDIEAHTGRPTNEESNLEACHANILTDPRNIVAHLTRGRMMKYIWNSAISAAVHSPPNKSNSNLEYEGYPVNYSFKFFNIDSQQAGARHYAQSMGFDNAGNMDVIELSQQAPSNRDLDSARSGGFDFNLPNENSPYEDGHIFGHSLVGDAAKGFTGDGKIRDDFEYSINNALCHSLEYRQDKYSIIFLFIVMQISTRLSNIELAERANHPIFMTDTGDVKLYHPLPNISYQLVKEYIERCETSSRRSVWGQLNYRNSGISRMIKDFLKISLSEEDQTFMPSVDNYSKLVSDIKSAIINSDNSPFSRDDIFQDLEDQHNLIKDLPNQINVRARRYRQYLHGIGALIERQSVGSRFSAGQVQNIGNFLSNINSGNDRSYRNVILDFLSRGNYESQQRNAGRETPTQRRALGESYQMPTADMGDFRRSSSADSDFNQTRGENVSGIRGLGAGGARVTSTFSNTSSSYLRSAEFKDKILRPLKDESLKTGKTNPFVIIAENICAQLFYGFSSPMMKEEESSSNLGYYHTFHSNKHGILSSMDLRSKSNNEEVIRTTIDEIFSIVWTYVQIGTDVLDSLPNFKINFKFTFFPESNRTSLEHAETSFEQAQERAFDSLGGFNTRDGVFFGENLGTLSEQVRSAEADLRQSINASLNFRAPHNLLNSDLNELDDGVNDEDRRNFRFYATMSPGGVQSLVNNLFDFVELSNAYFFVAESLTSIEPEFRLEIECIDDLSQNFAAPEVVSSNPIYYFQNGLKTGCLPHLSIDNPENLRNLRAVFDARASRIEGGTNLDSTVESQKVLDDHVKYFGSYKNVKVDNGQMVVNALQYGHGVFPSNNVYLDYIKMRPGNDGQRLSTMDGIYSLLPDEEARGDNFFSKGMGFLVFPKSICGYNARGNDSLTTMRDNYSKILNYLDPDDEESKNIASDKKINNFGFANVNQARADFATILSTGRGESINYNNRSGNYISSSPEARDAAIKAVVDRYTQNSGVSGSQGNRQKSYGPAWVYQQLTNKVARIGRMIGFVASQRPGSPHRTQGYEIIQVKEPVQAFRRVVEFDTIVSKVKYQFIEAISFISGDKDDGRNGRIGDFAEYAGAPTVPMVTREDWYKRTDRVNKAASQAHRTGKGNGKLAMDPIVRIKDMCKFAMMVLAQNSNAYVGNDTLHGFSEVYKYLFENIGSNNSGITKDQFKIQIDRFLYSLMHFVKEEQGLLQYTIPVYLPHYKRFEKGRPGVRLTEFMHQGYNVSSDNGYTTVGRQTNSTQSQRWPSRYSSDGEMYRMEDTSVSNQLFGPSFPHGTVFDKGIGEPRSNYEGGTQVPWPTNSYERHMSQDSLIINVIERIELLFDPGTERGRKRTEQLGEYVEYVNRHSDKVMMPSNDLTGGIAKINPDDDSLWRLSDPMPDPNLGKKRMLVPRTNLELWSDFLVPCQMPSRAAPIPHANGGYQRAGKIPRLDSNGRIEIPAPEYQENLMSYGCSPGAYWSPSENGVPETQHNRRMIQVQGDVGRDGYPDPFFNFDAVELSKPFKVADFVPFTVGRATFCSLGETATRELYINSNNQPSEEASIQYFNLKNNLNGTTNAYAASQFQTKISYSDQTNGAVHAPAADDWRTANRIRKVGSEGYVEGTSLRADWTIEDFENSFFYQYLQTPPISLTGSLNNTNQRGEGIFEDPKIEAYNPIYTSTNHMDSRSVRARLLVWSDFIRPPVRNPRFRLTVNPTYQSQTFSEANMAYPASGDWAPQTWSALVDKWRQAGDPGSDAWRQAVQTSIDNGEVKHKEWHYLELGILNQYGGPAYTDRQRSLLESNGVSTTTPKIDIFPFKPFVIDYGPDLGDFSPNLPWLHPDAQVQAGAGSATAMDIHTTHPSLTMWRPEVRNLDYNKPISYWDMKDPDGPADGDGCGNYTHHIDISTETNPDLGRIAVRYDRVNCKIIVMWSPKPALYRRAHKFPSSYHFYTPEPVLDINGTLARKEATSFFLWMPGYDYWFQNGSNPNGNLAPQHFPIFFFDEVSTTTDPGAYMSLFTEFRLRLQAWGSDYRVFFQDNFRLDNSTREEFELVNRRHFQRYSKQIHKKKIYLGGQQNTQDRSRYTSFSTEPILTDSSGAFDIDRDLFGIEGAQNIEELDISIPLRKNTVGGTFSYDFDEDDDILFEEKINLTQIREMNFGAVASRSDFVKINLASTFQYFFENYKYFPEINNQMNFSDILMPFSTSTTARQQYRDRRLVGVYEPHEVLGRDKKTFHRQIATKRKELKAQTVAEAKQFIEKIHELLNNYVTTSSYFQKSESQLSDSEKSILTTLGLWPEFGYGVQRPDRYLDRNFLRVASSYFVYLTPYELNYPSLQVFASTRAESFTLPGASIVDFKWQQIHLSGHFANKNMRYNLSTEGLKQIDSLYKLESDYLNFLTSLHKTSEFKEEAYSLAMENYKEALAILSNFGVGGQVNPTPLQLDIHEANKAAEKVSEIIKNIGIFGMTPDVLSNIESIYGLSIIHSMQTDVAGREFIKDPDLLNNPQAPGMFQVEYYRDVEDFRTMYLPAPFRLSPYPVRSTRIHSSSKYSHLSTWKSMEVRWYDQGNPLIRPLDEKSRVIVVGIESGALEKIINEDRLNLTEALQKEGRVSRQVDTSKFEIQLVLKDPVKPYLTFKKAPTIQPFTTYKFTRDKYFYLHPANFDPNLTREQLQTENFPFWQSSTLAQVLASSHSKSSFDNLIARKNTLGRFAHAEYLASFTYNNITESQANNRGLANLNDGHIERSPVTLSSYSALNLYLKKYISSVLGLDYYSFMIPVGEKYPILSNDVGIQEDELKGFDEVAYQEIVNPYLKIILEHLQNFSGDDREVFDTIKYFIDRRDLREIYQQDRITHFDSMGRKLLKPIPNNNFSIFNEKFIHKEGEDTLLRPFAFNAPVTRESLKAAETIVNINSYDPDGFRKVDKGFAFDEVVAIPYNLRNYYLSREIDTNYWTDLQNDYPDITENMLNGKELSNEAVRIIGSSLDYLEAVYRIPGDDDETKYSLKEEGNHPITVQAVLKPTYL